MPHRPPRVCSEPGCGAPTTDGPRCPKHKRAATKRPAWTQRQTAAERGRDWSWYNLRRKILKRDPVCMICRRAPSVTVDHIRNKARGGTDDPANLQGACTPCHAAKTKREAADGLRASRSRRSQRERRTH